MAVLANGTSLSPKAMTPLSGHPENISSLESDKGRLDMGNIGPLPAADYHNDQTISLPTSDGHTIMIKNQVQLYAPNNLLGHPLVSPVLAYLGDLPPLMVIAGQDEVLRDEIVYL